jgi:SAM-dependent methyltransferase
MNTNFELYAKYYNLLYRDKNYDLEGDYLHSLIKEYAPGAKTILELGVGTGKHARILCNKGFKVHGIDQSHEMLSIARAHNMPGLSFEQGDISSFTTTEKYDVALSLFHVISYVTRNDDVISTFRNVSNQLAPQGIFIFDVWHTPAVYYQRPESRIKEISENSLRVIRKAEPVVHYATNTVDVNYDVEIEDTELHEKANFQEKHTMRHFSQPEIAMIADITGFDLIAAEEFVSGKAPGLDTWAVCYVLKKTRAYDRS